MKGIERLIDPDFCCNCKRKTGTTKGFCEECGYNKEVVPKSILRKLLKK